MASQRKTVVSKGAAKVTGRAARGAPVVFLVPGQLAATPYAAPEKGTRGAAADTAGRATASPRSPGTLKASVRLGARRGGGGMQRLEAVPGEDVVALHLQGGPVLWLHPETARDLLRAQSAEAARAVAPKGKPRRGGAAGAGDVEQDEIVVSAQLRWHGLERAAPRRGGLGDVVLAAIEIFVGKSGLKDKAADAVAAQVVRQVDSQVEPGLYALEPSRLEKLKGGAQGPATLPAGRASTSPALVLIHGTFVETSSTFKKLWTEHPRRVRALFERYAGGVYALDHPTLGASPIANALTLVQSLPEGEPVRLHLLTHSRGGLVAEVLARIAHQRKIGAADLAFFPGAALATQRAELLALAREVAARDIRIERVVRVACPARGTLLASKRLDAYLSVLKWTLELARLPVAPEVVDFLAAVAQRRADPALIPGLAAMIPQAPLLRWLNDAPAPINGQLLVLAGDLRGEGVGSWLKTLLADAFYWGDNDIVVHTRAMYAGAPRAGGASFLLDQGGEVTHFNYFANERTAAAVEQALPGAAGSTPPGGAQKIGLSEPAPPPPGFAPIGPLSWQGRDASGVRGRERGRASTRSGGAPATDAAAAAALAQRPAVFVLPGILGSNLRNRDHRLWVGVRIVAGLHRIAYRPGGADGIQEDGPIGPVYNDLIEFLGRSHEVIPFGFDWRRPVEDEARRLARAIDAALDARKATGQPVRVIAHSMGGLVARTVQLEAPGTWKRWLAHKDARLVMLGTPNGGSWAPMQVLSGDDSMGNLLAVLGAPFADGRRIMAAMPGFLQLQAGLTDSTLGLARSERWQALADADFAQLQAANWWHRYAGAETQEAIYRWGVPPQEVLDRALALRRRLDEQAVRDLPAFADKLRLVVGRSRFTPDGFEVDAREGFVYLDAVDGGDGRVPLESAVLPDVRTWIADCEHGGLAGKEKCFGAYLELLQGGQTQQLAALPAQVMAAALQRQQQQRSASLAANMRGGRRDAGRGRGEGVEAGAGMGTSSGVPPASTVPHVHSRPGRQLAALAPPGDERDLDSAPTRAAAAMGAASGAATAPAGATSRDGGGGGGGGDGGDARGDAGATTPPLAVSVHNGNLSFVREALMIGHYRSLKLSGAERVLDGLLGGSLSASLAGGLYPEACHAAQVFGNSHRDPANPWALPRPLAAVVVGLGDEGELTPRQLAESVRQGALAWAQRAAEAPEGSAVTLELAATLMGSGGVGIRVGDAARAIVEGIQEANRRLAANGWPMVGTLRLIELYLDRADEAWRALRLLQNTRPDLCRLAEAITQGPGARRQMPDSGYRGADYDLVRVSGGGGEDGRIEFSLDTRRARTEVRAEQTQGPLVRELVSSAAQHGEHDAAIGRTLFRLLVPQTLEPFLGGTGQVVLDLDLGTAPIPWELLESEAHAARADPRPWALRCQLLRKLRTADLPASPPRDAHADDAVLVIGEPLTPPGYDPLPGARAEAEAVFATLAAEGGIAGERLTALFGEEADATAVITALLARRWRIVHVAGHGEPPDAKQPERKPNGVVLSGDVFLGPNEIRKMAVAPELVFVNCCHLAAHDARSTLSHRPRFAAGVADALIRAGVRCVVAAGWAVDDAPAEAFAKAFYARLLTGAPFIEAVHAAREAAWAADPEGKTWAAYQCYGDPNWTFRAETGDAQGARARAPALTGPAPEYDGIATPLALAHTLEDMAIVQGSATGGDAARRQAEMQDRLRHLESRFGEGPWGTMGAVAEAFGVAWEAARGRDRAITWYERALAAPDASASMKAAQSLHNLRVRRAELKARGGAVPKRRGKSLAPAGARGAARSAASSDTVNAACAEVAASRDELERLAREHPSNEGYALVGSANKRLALLYRRAGRDAEAQAALHATVAAYGKAEDLARASGDAGLFYPALNRIAAQLVLAAGDRTAVTLDPKALQAVRASLEAKHRDDPDFWSATALVELDLYQAVASRQLAARRDELLRRLADVRRRRANASEWESVATQADFVLDACVEAGAAAEAQAADALRAVLAGYAGAAGKLE